MPTCVYTGAEGFWKSTDGGKTFTTLRMPHGDNHDIWINPTNGQIMIQANDGGANVSTDGGRTWSTQNNQPTAEIYGVWMDNAVSRITCTARSRTATPSSLQQRRSVQHGRMARGPGCETGPIMPKPDNPDIVYGSCKGQYGVMDLKTGQEQNYWIGAQSLYGNPASDLIYRFQRVSPMATSPSDPNIVVLRVAVSPSHARQRRDVGKDFAGSHRHHPVLSGCERRAHHARRHRRGVLQHALRDCRVAARERRDLDGLERRSILRHAR